MGNTVIWDCIPNGSMTLNARPVLTKSNHLWPSRYSSNLLSSSILSRASVCVRPEYPVKPVLVLTLFKLVKAKSVFPFSFKAFACINKTSVYRITFQLAGLSLVLSSQVKYFFEKKEFPWLKEVTKRNQHHKNFYLLRYLFFYQ